LSIFSGIYLPISEKQMRDERFIAEHRGGPLSLYRHRLLAAWAADCAERVLPLFSVQHPQDHRPWQAIAAARAWSRGEITVGAARAASVAAHVAARDVEEGAARFAARSSGHAVATAHMADHAPGCAVYAIKAVKAATDSQNQDIAVEQELTWQLERLPIEIRELVVSTLEEKFARFLEL
jgi:hypothetical protein